MVQFRPFDMEGIPIEEQFMDWKEIVKRRMTGDL